MSDSASAAAERNDDGRFGGHLSGFADTDPELVGYFGNFAYGETRGDAAHLDATLDERTQVMVQLAAILAAAGLSQFRLLATAAVANAGVSPVELKELVYQAVAYVGMARAYDYIDAANEVLATAGIALLLAGQSAATPESRPDHGKSVQGRIIGDEAVAARFAHTEVDDAHFQRYLAANCFGALHRLSPHS